MPEQFLIGALLGLGIAIGAYAVRFLTLSGCIAAGILAVVIFGVGSWQWTIPIFSFFVSSSLLSRVGRATKMQITQSVDDHGARTSSQVLANGGVGGALALLALVDPSANVYPIYLGTLAAVNADTWGTEIGVLTTGRTFSLTSFDPVEPGSSGGVSLVGLGAGVLASVLINVSALYWILELRLLFPLIGAGLAGSIVDSLLGSLVQVRYRCAQCGSMTERPIHCDQPGNHVRGVRWVNNDVVNVACAATGGAVMWAFT